MDERRGAPALPPRLRLLQHDARRTAGPAGALRGTRPLHSPACLRPADGRGRQKPLAERVRVHRLPGEQDRHLSRLPPQHGRTGQDRGHHRFGTRRPGRDHHVGMAQRLRIARKSVDTQPHAGHRPHRSVEKAYRTTLPLRRGDHRNRLRTGGLGRTAQLCRTLEPDAPRGDTRPDRQFARTRRQGGENQTLLSRRVRFPAEKLLSRAAPHGLPDHVHRPHVQRRAGDPAHHAHAAARN